MLSNQHMEPNEQSEHNYLKELAPSLFDSKIEYEPTAPEGYFEEFGAKLNAEILAEESKPTLRKPSVLKLVNYKNLAIAASIAALIALIPFLRESSSDTALPQANIQSSLLALDLDEEDISDYLDMELIYDNVAEEELSGVTWSSELTEDEIITFLLKEDISEELIINTIQLN